MYRTAPGWRYWKANDRVCLVKSTIGWISWEGQTEKLNWIYHVHSRWLIQFDHRNEGGGGGGGGGGRVRRRGYNYFMPWSAGRDVLPRNGCPVPASNNHLRTAMTFHMQNDRFRSARSARDERETYQRFAPGVQSAQSPKMHHILNGGSIIPFN